MSGTAAIATARTMRGMLIMKSVIGIFGTVGDGSSSWHDMVPDGVRTEVRGR